jgi:CHAD domain-containing protein
LSELRRFAVEDGSDITKLVSGLQQRAPFQREPNRSLRATVLDTFDWRIHGEGTTLVLERSAPVLARGRRPSEPTSTTWLIWRSASTGEVLGRAAVDRAPPFVWDLPPGPLAERLAPILEMRALLPLATFEAEEIGLRLVDDEGKTRVRVVIDQAQLEGTDTPFTPLVEVVTVRGYERDGDAVADLLAAQVVLRSSDHDVIAAALTEAGHHPGDYSSKLKLSLDPTATALNVVVVVLATLLDTMLANEAGTRADIDSEFLHDFRVAVRRTRSVLGMAKGVVPAPLLEHLRAEFKWLGDITTPTRDLDVYLLEYPSFEAGLPEAVRPDLAGLHQFLVDRQAEAQRQLVCDLDRPRYAALLDRYRAWLADPQSPAGAGSTVQTPRAEVAASEFGAGQIWKAYRGMVRDGRRITPSSPAESLHDLRKDAKKLRYALECFGSLFPADEVAPVVKELKAVQDVLGEFQDCEVQKGSLRGFGESIVAEQGPGSARTVMAMGYLIERLDERERAARGRFDDCFGRFDAGHNRHRFRQLFAPKEIDA